MALDLQCVVLAGGLGARMRPHTETIPKALLPVAGVPFAHHQLTLLASQGIGRVAYCIGYRGEQLRDFVGDGSRWGLAVEWVDEGESLRGTGGALRLALDAGVLAERFFVTYGDSYLPIDMRAVWQHFTVADVDVLMTVLENKGRWDTSNVVFDEGTLVYDKHGQQRWGERMRFIDFGLLAMRRSVVAEIPVGEVVDLSDTLRDLSTAGRVGGYEIHERFFEVGSPAGVRDLEAFLGTQHPTAT